MQVPEEELRASLPGRLAGLLTRLSIVYGNILLRPLQGGLVSVSGDKGLEVILCQDNYSGVEFTLPALVSGAITAKPLHSNQICATNKVLLLSEEDVARIRRFQVPTEKEINKAYFGLDRQMRSEVKKMLPRWNLRQQLKRH